MKRFFAFTLAETLIVMGIIGIVSALTLPNLNSSTGEKEKVAKVKKIYQNLNDAYGRATAIYGPIDEWFKNDTDVAAQTTRFGERITEFMKVSKNCGISLGCFSATPFVYLLGDVHNSNDAQNLVTLKAYMYILADGTSVAFYYNTDSNGGNVGYYILVDIDGPNKGKNQEGVDRFSFFIDIESGGQLIPSGRNSTEGAFDDDYDINSWVIYNENLDYLKCADKLNWKTKTSCK